MKEYGGLVFIFGFFICLYVLACILEFIEKCRDIKRLKEAKLEFEKEQKLKNDILKIKENDAYNKIIAAEKKEKEIKQEALMLITEREGLRRIALERQKGCPWLEDEYERLFALRDNRTEDDLYWRPAPKAAEQVKEANTRRRFAERNERVYKNLVEYYENIAPFLLDLKEEVVSDDDIEGLQKYSEEERQDKVVEFLTIDEYHKLSVSNRNQLALDRYWKRPKSCSHIGRVYERFIGYQYESKGFDVNYFGIFKGLEDLGRDLVCTKGKAAHIIQCKYWSQFKTIHEKHIFQLFGTMYQYKKEMLRNKKYNKVIGLFCTTTNVSPLAHEFAKDIGVEIRDNFKMDFDYPCIKCNVNSATKEKIYHLPFDQMYDKVKIEINKGEFYCKMVKEAEQKGFRRAMRYMPVKTN